MAAVADGTDERGPRAADGRAPFPVPAEGVEALSPLFLFAPPDRTSSGGGVFPFP